MRGGTPVPSAPFGGLEGCINIGRLKEMRISIFGLGYVGAVAGACIADSGNEVIAVDPDVLKVKCIREGRSPIVEPGLEEMISKNVAAGRLKATSDCAEAVLNSDMSL